MLTSIEWFQAISAHSKFTISLCIPFIFEDSPYMALDYIKSNQNRRNSCDKVYLIRSVRRCLELLLLLLVVLFFCICDVRRQFLTWFRLHLQGNLFLLFFFIRFHLTRIVINQTRRWLEPFRLNAYYEFVCFWLFGCIFFFLEIQLNHFLWARNEEIQLDSIYLIHREWRMALLCRNGWNAAQPTKMKNDSCHELSSSYFLHIFLQRPILWLKSA